MEETIKTEDIRKFNHLSIAYSVVFIISIMAAIPLIWSLGVFGLAIEALLLGAALFLAFLVEERKKQFDIHTYQEITAFIQG